MVGARQHGHGSPNTGAAYAFRLSHDCNENGVLDSCDIAGGFSFDCNNSGLPDECEPGTADCNNNAVPDLCDLQEGTSPDCNSTGIPDECEIADGSSPDCNTNAIPDDCDLRNGASDCDNNGVPDECQPDDDGDGTPDVCDLDNDGDGIPDDEDECPASPPGEPVNEFGGPIGDFDGDCALSMNEYAVFEFCLALTGPAGLHEFVLCALIADADLDGDTDLRDFAAFQRAYWASGAR